MAGRIFNVDWLEIYPCNRLLGAWMGGNRMTSGWIYQGV
jgi:hypothetical protein